MQAEEIIGAIRTKKEAFILSLMGALVLLSMSADIVLLPEVAINPFLDPVRLLLVGAIAFLMATHITVYVAHQARMGISCIGGFGLSFFASACVVCQPLWLIALGFGSATAFLADVATPLMLVSVALLFYSLITFNNKKTCEVKK